MTERRNSARLRVHSPAYVRLNGSSSAKAGFLSEILNIGEGGISIRTSFPLEIDHNLDVRLDFAETKTRISTTGLVVWSTHSGRAGIRFSKLPSQSLLQLREWLFVNVLTAFDHARGWTTLAKAHTPDEVIPAPEPTDNRESLAELNAIRKEVEAGGYDREAALQLIAERALRLTRATGAAIALSVSDEMICQASAGSDAPPLGSRLQASSGFSGTCVRLGRCLRCDESETDDRVDREGCRALGIRSIVAVPVQSGSRVAGLLEIFSSQPYAFSDKDISVLQGLSGAVLCARQQGADTSASLPDSHERPPILRQSTRIEIQAPLVEEQPSAELLGESRTPGSSPRSSVRKVMLAFVVMSSVFAVLWLIAPWVSRRISASGQEAFQVQKPRVPVSEELNTRGNSDDFNNLASLLRMAQRGDPGAQFVLGARYATGEEVRQDYSEAKRWFTLAADQGHILAQATLGAYYWAGRGASPDLSKAYFWAALAQAGGDQASKYRVAVLTSRMSRTEILAAQQQVNDWLRNHQMDDKVPPSR